MDTDVRMDNHYHLLIKTSCGNVSRALQLLNVSYASVAKKQEPT
jgi:hypothetical protein